MSQKQQLAEEQQAHLNRVLKITDLIDGYNKVSSYSKIEKKLNNGKCTKLKRLNLMRGRYYYPSSSHKPRNAPTRITLIKNTALNTFSGSVEEATDAEIYQRMYVAKQREKFIKANAFVSNIMGMAGDSYKKALAMHGLTNSDNMFEYNEDEDDEDYEPSESDTEDEEKEDGEEQNDEDEEQFEEQEGDEDDEEQQEDEDEDQDEDEGFEMEDDFEDSDE